MSLHQSAKRYANRGRAFGRELATLAFQRLRTEPDATPAIVVRAMVIEAGVRSIEMEAQGVPPETIAAWMTAAQEGWDGHLTKLIEMTDPFTASTRQ